MRGHKTTRPDTRIPQSRVGGQGLYLRSLDHLGRSSEAKDRKNKKVRRMDRQTDGRTDGPTKRGVESRSTRLKISSENTIFYIIIILMAHSTKLGDMVSFIRIRHFEITNLNKSVFLVSAKNAFVPLKRDNSVNTCSRISTVPRGSERSE